MYKSFLVLALTSLITGEKINNEFESSGNISESLLYIRRAIEASVGKKSSPISVSSLKQFAWYTSASFCDTKQIRNWSCKPCRKVAKPTIHSVYEHPALKTKFYISSSDKEKRVFLAFRSTENKVNEENNFDISLVSLPGVNKPGLKVHSGFLKGMQALEPVFSQALSKLYAQPKYQDYTLTVIGHSLGGAIASLTAAKLNSMNKKYFPKMDLITYGQPKTGNGEYANWVNKQTFDKFRVVSENDNIPHFEVLDKHGFVHHQREVWIHNNKTIYCSTKYIEDPKCSVSLIQSNLKDTDHFKYFNTVFGPGSC